MNTYRYTFGVKCPSNGDMIIYSLELAHPEMVMVEKIKAVCAEWSSGFQEHIAEDLSKQLGGKLTLRATHHGVDVETVLIPKSWAKRWTLVDRLQLEVLGASIETEISYVGAVMGHTYEWIKGAKEPYLTIRELNTGELIKCIYADEDYAKVARLFSDKSAIVIVQGSAKFNRLTGKTEVTKAQDFDIAPSFSDADFEKFFGCAPNLTGDVSTSEFIRRSRDDE